MLWSCLVSSTLALTGAAVATRPPRHVPKQFEHPARNGPGPNARLKTREHVDAGKRANAATQFQFLTNATAKFAVNGTGIPEVDFDIGESYAGSIPVTTDAAGDYLFFWFFPTVDPHANKDIIIWLNGGPGCSSLEGFLQENGPFLWQYGTFKPVPNPYSWHKLANVLWVEQPVGTGFSQGKVTVTSEQDVAVQFMSWFKNFVDTFALQGYKVYITGESFAGQYVPYIASGFLDANDTTYYDLQGILLYDPAFGYEDLQTEFMAVPFVESWSGLFPLNDTFLADIRARDISCGFADFRDKYLKFPPPGYFPTYENLPSVNTESCYLIWFDVIYAVTLLNPCFDLFQVATTCPVLWDVLGYPGSFRYLPNGAEIYFDRKDVKLAIHAPMIPWSECTGDPPVFVNSTDNSDPSAFTVLPSVIDRTKNVIIGQGNLDMRFITEGTLLQIQNITWGGLQGFQSAPDNAFYVPYHTDVSNSSLAGAGVFGKYGTERGLTFVSINLSGHMVPQYAPSAAFRHIEVLLGRVSNLSSTDPFTTVF